MNRRTADGYSLLEVVFVGALGATLAAAAVPEVLTGIDEHRTSIAARYVAARFQRARTEAVMRSAIVALQFTQTTSGYAFAEYVDGNRNGVLASDMRSGVDWQHGAIERLPDQFTGVDFGVIPGLPPIDSGGAPPGPIRFVSAPPIARASRRPARRRRAPYTSEDAAMRSMPSGYSAKRARRAS